MWSCYAATSSHLDSCGECTGAPARRTSSANSAWTLLQLNSVWEEVASFFKHAETKRDPAMCSSPVIVASAAVPNVLNGNYWRLPTPARSPGQLKGPWPCNIQRGEMGAVKTYTSPCSQREFLLQLLPHGALPHTPANQLHFITPRPLSGCGPFSHLCYRSAPLKFCVSVWFMAAEAEIRPPDMH